ncbi:MAG: hypothetical protein PHC84_03110 [Clostridia bacterium]|nr:hypothetical protein [Clostridia bacterium]
MKKTKGLGEKKAQKIASMILIAFGLVTLLSYFVFFTAILTRSAIAGGQHEKLLYMFVGMSQFAVLFLGAFASMSYLYFSKDNQLLASLPVSSKAVFMAKFAMSYIAEFVIGALVMIPTVTTYGVVCIVSGIKLNAVFFITELLGVFIFPAVPLLLISLISLPLMYVMALIRKRTLSNAIAVGIIIVLVMSVYFGLIGSFANMSQNMQNGVIALSPQLAALLNNAQKITVFNKPFIDAMLGRSVALNMLVYVAGIIVLMAVNIMLSSIFYKKGISVIIEGDGKRDANRAKKELVYTSAGLKYSLIRKEIKTLANTPMMLVNSLMGVILGPIILIFMSKSGSMNIVDNAARAQLYSIGFVSYFVSLMVGATNQVAMVGFSREGQNLFTLKALPLSAAMLVKIKLLVATMMNALTVVLVSVVYFVITPGNNIVQVLIIALVTLSCGFGINCLGLYNDLKNPNLKWLNANELTKNNKRALKPMLTAAGVGISYMVMGMLLSMQEAINLLWSYVLFCCISLLANTLLVIVGYKKLFDNPQELLDRVEG